MNRNRLFIRIALVATCALLIACPDDEDQENFSVDSGDIPGQIEQDLQAHYDASRAATGWVEETRIWQATGFPLGFVAEQEAQDESESLRAFLSDYVFVDEHIDAETETSVTYLLDGERVCDGFEAEFGGALAFDLVTGTPADIVDMADIADIMTPNDTAVLGEFNDVDNHDNNNDHHAIDFDGLDELRDLPETDVLGDIEEIEFFDTDDARDDDVASDDQFDHQECVRTINAADLRLRVTSAVQDQLTINTLVADEEYNPARFTIDANASTMDLNLDEAFNSFDYIREELGEEDAPTTPDVLEGALTWSFEIESDAETRRQLSIDDRIRVETADLSLEAGSTDRVFERWADGNAEEMETTVDWERIELALPLEEDVEAIDDPDNGLDDEFADEFADDFDDMDPRIDDDFDEDRNLNTAFDDRAPQIDDDFDSLDGDRNLNIAFDDSAPPFDADRYTYNGGRNLNIAFDDRDFDDRDFGDPAFDDRDFDDRDFDDRDFDDRQQARLVLDGFGYESRLSGENDDELSITDLRIDDPLSLLIDEETVFSLDWGTVNGDPLDLMVRAPDDRVELAFDSPTELILDFQFEDHAADLGLPSWVSDDTWTLRLDEADTPTIAIYGLPIFEVLDGRFTLESTHEEMTMQVNDGECLRPGVDDRGEVQPSAQIQTFDDHEGFDNFDNFEDFDNFNAVDDHDADAMSDEHPLATFGAGDC